MWIFSGGRQAKPKKLRFTLRLFVVALLFLPPLSLSRLFFYIYSFYFACFFAGVPVPHDFSSSEGPDSSFRKCHCRQVSEVAWQECCRLVEGSFVYILCRYIRYSFIERGYNVGTPFRVHRAKSKLAKTCYSYQLIKFNQWKIKKTAKPNNPFPDTGACMFEFAHEAMVYSQVVLHLLTAYVPTLLSQLPLFVIWNLVPI